MVSIGIAIIGIIVCSTHAHSTMGLILEIIAFALAAFLSNYMLRPRAHGYQFSEEEYQLQDVFELSPLEVNEDGRPVYLDRVFSKNDRVFLKFKCPSRTSTEPHEHNLPRGVVKLIYDDKPHIKLYSAYKEFTGNVLLSVMSCKVADLVAEIHAPDTIAAFSKDSMVKS